MNKRLMQRWVKALRSGEYKQGKNCLKDKQGNYCCLGVLCELEGLKHHPFESYYIGKKLKSEDGLLMKSYKAPNGRTYHNLAYLNDSGLTFKQIARIIEKNYKDL